MKEKELWKYIYIEGQEPEEDMYYQLARRIRGSRIVRNNGWRGVAAELSNDETSNQLLGMWLCRHAMLFFGETDKDGWN